MIYLVAAFILWHFEASILWWIAYAAVIGLQIFVIVYKAYKEVYDPKPSVLLKANGQPYTEDDLEFIWKHGYHSAQEVINSTKQ